MLLDDIINNIINKIRNIPLEEPVFIYTGVGAAAGSVDENGILQLQNYHQYPPFLQNLKNTIPNLHIFIILIDPYQETPPYMATDKNLILGPNEMAPNEIANEMGPNEMGPNDILNDPIEYYSNKNKNINVYVMRKCVYTDPYQPNNNYINITDQLRNLNSFAIDNSRRLGWSRHQTNRHPNLPPWEGAFPAQYRLRIAVRHSGFAASGLPAAPSHCLC